ncbi:hypothetical protein V2K74_09240 [Streptococcus pneumoniae]|nr:Uncharacterised protein [Streptococcus pneumoniae]
MENNDSFTKLKESTQKLFDAQKKRLNNEDRIETTKNNVIAKHPKFQVEVSHPKEIHLATCSPSIF